MRIQPVINIDMKEPVYLSSCKNNKTPYRRRLYGVEVGDTGFEPVTPCL